MTIARGSPHEISGVLIGLDGVVTIGGASAAGPAAVLVRAGKYRAGRETALAPTLVADNPAVGVVTIPG
ncbi:MAG TPA: hypothetical protein PKA55_12595 [Rhodoblastus sp.]|nr:hypothetical protein [Rhodoblastus sp.]